MLVSILQLSQNKVVIGTVYKKYIPLKKIVIVGYFIQLKSSTF